MGGVWVVSLLVAWVVTSPMKIVRAQKISGLFLVNTQTNRDIRRVGSNDVIAIDQLQTNQLTLRVEVENSPSLVRFFINGRQTSKERAAPYSARGDRNSNFMNFPLLSKTGTEVRVEVRSFAFDASGRDKLADRLFATLRVVGSSPVTTTTAATTSTTATVAATTTTTIFRSSKTDVPAYNVCPQGCRSGEPMIWHKQTLGFRGPMSSELASPNPFTDIRMRVRFTHESGSPAKQGCSS